MGSVHPRTKLIIGERLARGINKFVYNNDGIWQGPYLKECQFDQKNGIIILQFNQDLLYDEQIIIQPFNLWYDNNLTEQIQETSAFEIKINGRWILLERDTLQSMDNNIVIVNIHIITSQSQIIEGIRYAWQDDACCGTLNLKDNPCPMNLCPIITSKTKLPALPFKAQIIDNKCKCYAPQKCDGSNYQLPGMYVSNSDSPTINPTDFPQQTMTTNRRLSTITNTEEILLHLTRFDEDWPEFVCISNDDDMVNNKFIGEYHRNDITSSSNITVPYWIHSINSEQCIFYDSLSSYWQIGSMVNMENNLVCFQSVSMDEFKSPFDLDCDQWLGGSYGNDDDIKIYTIILKPITCNNDHNDDVNSISIASNLDKNNVKITLYIFMFECLSYNIMDIL